LGNRKGKNYPAETSHRDAGRRKKQTGQLKKKKRNLFKGKRKGKLGARWGRRILFVRKKGSFSIKGPFPPRKGSKSCRSVGGGKKRKRGEEPSKYR